MAGLLAALVCTTVPRGAFALHPPLPSDAQDWQPSASATETFPVRVRFPAGTPADEACELVVEATPPPGVIDARPASPREIGDHRPRWFELCRVVARDGEVVTLPLPRAAEAVRVRLDASYLYLERGQLDVGFATDVPLEVLPELGSRVTLRFVPPAHSVHDPRSLVGASGMARYDDPTIQRFESVAPSRDFVLDADLVATVRAIPTRTRLTWGASGRASGALFRRDGGLVPFEPEVDSVDVLACDVRLDVPLADRPLLVGRAVDDDGNPLADLGLSSVLRGLAARRPKDRPGSFEALVTPDDELVLHAPGFREWVIAAPAAHPAAVHDLGDVVLEALAPVTGRVVAGDGRPVAGFPLRAAHAFKLGEDTEGTTRTDEAGRFVFRPTRDQPLFLYGRASVDASPLRGVRALEGLDGDAPSDCVPPRTAMAGDDVELVITSTCSISGVARYDDGRPVERVRVMAILGTLGAGASWQGSGNLSGVVDTDDGRFTWGALYPGTWRVFVSAPGSPQVECPVVVPGDGARFEATLERPVRIRGRVVDSTGAPVQGAEVHLARTPTTRAPVVTDESGEFEFNVEPYAHYRVCAKAGDLSSAPAGPFDLASGDVRDGIVLELARPGDLIVVARRERSLATDVVFRDASGYRHEITINDQGFGLERGMSPGVYELVVGDGQPSAIVYVVNIEAGKVTTLDLSR